MGSALGDAVSRPTTEFVLRAEECECGGQSRVVRTRRQKTIAPRYRTRECLTCGERWVTEEKRKD